MVYAYGFCLDDRRIKNAADPCSNASGLATSCFIMLMLCPLPISLYVNNLQKGKYKRSFNRSVLLLYWILSSVRSCILQALQIILRQCQQRHAILIITFLAVILTFWIRYWNHRSRSDCLLFFGLLITMLSVIFEAISVYYKVSVSGIFVGIAILILLFINVIYTIHIIRDIIKRQQQEELDKRKKYRRDVSAVDADVIHHDRGKRWIYERTFSSCCRVFRFDRSWTWMEWKRT